MKQQNRKIAFVLAMLLVFIMSTPVMSNAAESPVNLGTAGSFSLLAGSTITNTGTTTIAGNVGLHPGTAFSGQGTAVVSGEIHLADAVALQAKNDFFAAYTDLASRVGNGANAELGGNTMTPGVYSVSSGFQITGTLTLDGQNDSEAIFIFKAGSTLTTASSSRIELINGANPNNVFWQVGTSATLGTNSEFKGNILAMESITATTGANIIGRLLTMTGAITLDNNSISNFILVPIEATTEPGTTDETTTDEATTDETTSESGIPATTSPVDLTYGSLTVSKVVTGNTGNMNMPRFDITVTGPENFTATRSFANGENYTWVNLVPGIYNITEDRTGLTESWSVTGVGAVSVIGDQSRTVIITNHFAGVVTIPQTGQSSNYNMAMTLGGFAILFAGAGLAVINNKKKSHG